MSLVVRVGLCTDISYRLAGNEYTHRARHVSRESNEQLTESRPAEACFSANRFARDFSDIFFLKY